MPKDVVSPVNSSMKCSSCLQYNTDISHFNRAMTICGVHQSKQIVPFTTEEFEAVFGTEKELLEILEKGKFEPFAVTTFLKRIHRLKGTQIHINLLVAQRKQTATAGKFASR